MVIRQKPVEVPVLTWYIPLLEKASSRRSYDAERHHIRYGRRNRACLPQFSPYPLGISILLTPWRTARISRIVAYADDA